MIKIRFVGRNVHQTPIITFLLVYFFSLYQKVTELWSKKSFFFDVTKLFENFILY
jgi:hypothetical protein